MKREKFPTRVIRIVSNLQIQVLLSLAPVLPIDPEHPIVVTIGEEVKVRGLDQNGLYWLRLGEIAEQGWMNQRRYPKEVWHEYCRQNIMPEIVTTKEGELRSKWVESPDGSAVCISTTLLEKKCFADYTTAVEALGASIGVEFSVNPRERMPA